MIGLGVRIDTLSKVMITIDSVATIERVRLKSSSLVGEVGLL